jgi:hypothetical protein
MYIWLEVALAESKLWVERSLSAAFVLAGSAVLDSHGEVECGRLGILCVRSYRRSFSWW